MDHCLSTCNGQYSFNFVSLYKIKGRVILKLIKAIVEIFLGLSQKSLEIFGSPWKSSEMFRN